MSTRRRLGLKQNAERADRRNVLPEVYTCHLCRRQFAKGTRREILDRHLASHGIMPPAEPSEGAAG